MKGQFSAFGRHVLSVVNAQEFALDVAGFLEDIGDFAGSDPLLGPNETLLFVANVNKALLYLLMRWDRGGRVSLMPEPGDQGLQGPIGAAPAIVVEAVLHVVMIRVSSMDKTDLSIDSCSRYKYG